MLRYKINSNGKKYISNPARNEDGRIPTPHFKNMITMYTFEKGKYTPSEFKNYIESLNILNDKDWEKMATKDYPKWKHYIDAAKQQLLKNQILVKNQDGTFSIFPQKLDETYNKISDYVETVLEPFEIITVEQEEYPPKKVTTTIIRRIRDSALSNKIKEERNYQCQVCGTVLIIRDGGYAETHHVKPLGHDGLDTETNMLVLCPNHHVLFDYGEIAISPEDHKSVIDSTGDNIAILTPPLPKREYVEYHYNYIYKKNQAARPDLK